MPCPHRPVRSLIRSLIAPLARRLVLPLVVASCLTGSASGQELPPADRAALEADLATLQAEVTKLEQRDDLLPARLADVAVCAKAVAWPLKYNEFPKPENIAGAKLALTVGAARLKEVLAGKSPWETAPGRTVRGYRSKIEGSYQPYACTLPGEFGKDEYRRWPVHLVLHGRGGTLTEASFFKSHEGKAPVADQNWIQIDVYGRGNNAYRFAGETDVFEALADVRRRYRIDDKRIVLHGFSMGGAGSWHLGLHHPSEWCSVGPGAGFIDFYKYQKVTSPLPHYQHNALKIYDAIDYALNAANVPICTYGGEQDAQLVASTSMVEEAKKLGIDIKLVIGKGVGHKFTPEGQKEFMDFHKAQQAKGRPAFLDAVKVRFVTHTLKYNRCSWLTVEEMIEPYQPAIVEAEKDANGHLKVRTKNVAVLQIARDMAERVNIDGTSLPLIDAAEGLLPGVYYEAGEKWSVQSYDASINFTKNLDRRKRHDLQGPIDDAFMSPFVCVRGTGTPLVPAQKEWSDFVLKRFTNEFDRWMRGSVPVIDDKDLTDELALTKHVVLFGDPGSNSYLKKIVSQLPVKWNGKEIVVNGKTYDAQTHGVSFIFPNPLAPSKYVVINSGHTFHDAEFKASNAQLYPRLGDIAVQQFEKNKDGTYTEKTVWAELFDNDWRLPEPATGRKNGCAE